jgi:hypothetical protein
MCLTHCQHQYAAPELTCCCLRPWTLLLLLLLLLAGSCPTAVLPHSASCTRGSACMALAVRLGQQLVQQQLLRELQCLRGRMKRQHNEQHIIWSSG